MDEERIGLVLAKTSELRSKIVNCIQKTTSNVERESGKSASQEYEANSDAENQDIDGDEEEAESLLNINDALESLEAQLSSLQALQQRQCYEKEAALAEIEHGQEKLLKELKEYKGKDLEVIHEAISFASVTEDADLLLPPYPSRPSRPAVSQNGYLSTCKSPQNDRLENPEDKPDNPSRPSGSSKWSFFGTVAKAALTVVGAMAVLSLAGFEPRMRKRDNGFVRIVELFGVDGIKGSLGGGGDMCPPGKVAVTGDGETRCVVKERVEVPFESIVAMPDVSYGCG